MSFNHYKPNNKQNTMNTESYTKVSPAAARKLAELKAEAAALAAAKAMKNARLVLSRLNKYYHDRKPWERQTAQEITKMHIQALERFISAAHAPALRSISVSIEWKKSRTWGWCPRAFVRINGFTYESRAGGCGYDKLSAAVSSAMSNSPSWRRFVIENCRGKGSKCYGFEWYSMPAFDFGGCGMSTLRAFLKECGWKGVQYDRETYDKQGGLISLFYSVEA